MKEIKKILMIMPSPFSRNFGASKVPMELADEYRNMGLTVEFFSSDHAFPWKKLLRPRMARFLDFFFPPFSYYAKRFVQKVGKEFQVIDSNIGNLPFSKRQLNFPGALISRSAGFFPDYVEFDQKNRVFPKTAFGFFEDAFLKRALDKEMNGFFRAMRYSDSIIVSTLEEKGKMRSVSPQKNDIWVAPPGIPRSFAEELRKVAHSTENRLKNPIVSFLGAWGARKGSRDWRAIILEVRKAIPQVMFHLLGTQWDKVKILKEIGSDLGEAIVVIPRYDFTTLPKLLAPSTVGAFPSYLEGFGIAPLEQMAAGIPVVGYDIPGPRDTVGKLNKEYLLAPGNTTGFAEKIIQILSMSENEYTNLVKKCFEIVLMFRNDKIAKKTLEIYRRYIY